MKKSKFLLYIVIVLIGVTIIDVAFRLIFTPLFSNPPLNTKAGAIYKFIAYKDPANIIILGASRANHHYISQQMEDSLGVSVYNYGWDGRCTLYQYLCLLRGIDNGGLNTVILDLSSAQLSKKWVDERICDLYPYYWENDTFKMMINEVEKKDMSLLMLSSLVQYNSQYLNFVAPMANVKGYSPLAYTGKALDITNISIQELEGHEEVLYSDVAIKYLFKMFKLCNEKNIRFVVCLSPSLHVSSADAKYLTSLCESNNITCWNLTEYITDPFLFSDFNHLNDKGAKLFTTEIIRKIKSINN